MDEHMKSNRFFSTSLIVFLFCFALPHAVMAQEELIEIAKKISPSTVVVLTYDKEGKIINQGSGFFISEKGDVIIISHILEGAYRAEVKVADGKAYPIAHIVAEDKETGIIRASVDISAKKVHPLSISSYIPKEGEQITVIGNPTVSDQAVSEGIVVAVREIPLFGKIVQISAPLPRSLNGSPIANLRGEVIGVAIYKSIEGQKMRFAVPGEKIAKLKLFKEMSLAEWETRRRDAGIDSAEGLYSTGLTFLWSDNFEKALPYFEKASQKDPRHFEAYLQIGYSNVNLLRYSDAIEAYKKAIHVKPDYAEAHFNLGMAYSKLNYSNEAIEAYKQAIRIKPDYAEAHFNLGVVYGKFNYFDEAIEAYKKAISINPNYAEAHFKLGVIYDKVGRTTEAIEAHKQVIRIRPDYSEAHYNLGMIYGALRLYPEALDAFRQSIFLRPDDVNAHYNIGVIYGKLKRYNEALESYKQAILIDPYDGNTYYNIGIIYGKLNDYAEALEAYKKALALKPDDADVYYNLGVIYGKLNDTTHEIEAYKQAIALKSDHALAYFSLGVVFLSQRDNDSAIEQYKILKDLDSKLAKRLHYLIFKREE